VDVPREEWIGVPLPDPGISKEWVLAARKTLEENEKVSGCGRHLWELTGGVLRDAACGGAMVTNFITPRQTGYCRCNTRYTGWESASVRRAKKVRAEETETTVWEFVSSILKDPERLRRGLDEMLDRERASASRGPDEEEEAWLKKLSELEIQETARSTSTWRGSWKSTATGRGSPSSSRPVRPSRKSSGTFWIEPLT
jgi:hypothetical protein